jgi:hypothetical protein
VSIFCVCISHWRKSSVRLETGRAVRSIDAVVIDSATSTPLIVLCDIVCWFELVVFGECVRLSIIPMQKNHYEQYSIKTIFMAPVVRQEFPLRACGLG